MLNYLFIYFLSKKKNKLYPYFIFPWSALGPLIYVFFKGCQFHNAPTTIPKVESKVRTKIETRQNRININGFE